MGIVGGARFESKWGPKNKNKNKVKKKRKEKQRREIFTSEKKIKVFKLM